MSAHDLLKCGADNEDYEKIITNDDDEKKNEEENDKKLSISYSISILNEKTPIILGVKHADFTREDVEKLFGEQ